MKSCLVWTLENMSMSSDAANGWIIVDGKSGRTLYIEYTKRTKDNSPKRPSDGTVRETVASGWFDDDGGFPEFSRQPWYEYRETIEHVAVLDAWAPTSCKYLFDGLSSCVDFDIRKLDTRQCSSLEGMFRGCSSVTQLIDVGGFDTKKVTNVSYMFMNCLKLAATSVAGWDVSNITESACMMSGCKAYVMMTEAQKSILGQESFMAATVTGTWVRAM